MRDGHRAQLNKMSESKYGECNSISPARSDPVPMIPQSILEDAFNTHPR